MAAKKKKKRVEPGEMSSEEIDAAVRAMEQVNYTSEEPIAEALSMDPTNIKRDFVQLPGHFAFYGEKAAVAMRSQLRAKAEVKRCRARVYLDFKEDAEVERADGTKRKFSEAQLDAMVETHPHVVEAGDELIECEYQKAHAYGELEALRSKRDALVSITGHVRDERKAMGLSGAADEDDL